MRCETSASAKGQKGCSGHLALFSTIFLLVRVVGASLVVNFVVLIVVIIIVIIGVGREVAAKESSGCILEEAPNFVLNLILEKRVVIAGQLLLPHQRAKVNVDVLCKVVGAVEGLVTERAEVGLLPGVDKHVTLKVLVAREVPATPPVGARVPGLAVNVIGHGRLDPGLPEVTVELLHPLLEPCQHFTRQAAFQQLLSLGQ